MLVLGVSLLLSEDCDDIEGAALCWLSLVTDGANVSTGDQRLLGRFPFSFPKFRGGEDGRSGGIVLRFESLSFGFDASRFGTPCLPIRMNGTRRRDMPAKAVVAINVLVYASSGYASNPFPLYDDQIAVVIPMPRGTARRLAV